MHCVASSALAGGDGGRLTRFLATRVMFYDSSKANFQALEEKKHWSAGAGEGGLCREGGPAALANRALHS